MESSGAVLAGGISERFGSDKRFFKLKEKTLVEIAIEKLKKVFERVYVVCDDERNIREKLKKNIKFDFEIIEDIEKYKGPLTGIYSFFKKTGEKSGFFIPCDMPHLPLEFIKYFKELIERLNFSKIITISPEKPLPLFINSEFLLQIENYLKFQNSIKGFIKLIQGKSPEKIYFIPEEELLTFGNKEHYLKNINIPEDLL